MRKESKIIEENSIYKVIAVINDIALVHSSNGKKGLINIETNEIVASFDDYITTIFRKGELFLQSKKVNKSDGKSSVYTRIYDAKEKKLLADDYIFCEELNCYVIILQDLKTKKYHLFDKINYRNNPSVFDREYDDISVLDSSNSAEWLLKVTKNGKKAIYSTKKGLIPGFEYDDIEKYSYATIFTQGKKKYFAYIDSSKKVEKSPLFDDIKHESIIGPLLYCKNDSNITIYYVGRWYCKELFYLPLYNEIKKMEEIILTGKYSGIEYIFLVNQNNKYGLISGFVTNNNAVPVLRTLVDTEYDKIELVNGNYFLYKSKKVGLFIGNSQDKISLDVKYDKITPILNTNYYELTIGDNTDIVDLLSNKTIISGCKIINNYPNSIVFERNGKQGIIIGLSIGEECKIYEGFDDIKLLDHISYYNNSYYEIIKNGKVGILYRKEILIEPEYESIQVNGMVDYSSISNTLYFALKKDNGDYDIAKLNYNIYGSDISKLEYINSEGYEDIEFYNSIMIYRDAKMTYVYGYDERLVKILPRNVQILENTVKIEDAVTDIYMIDGVYYMLIDKKFEKVPIETSKLYMTAYESEYGTVVVNSYSKEEHDEKCHYIESCENESFNDTLIRLYEDNSSIQKQYPKLIKKMNKQ